MDVRIGLLSSFYPLVTGAGWSKKLISHSWTGAAAIQLKCTSQALAVSPQTPQRHPGACLFSPESARPPRPPELTRGGKCARHVLTIGTFFISRQLPSSHADLKESQTQLVGSLIRPIGVTTYNVSGKAKELVTDTTVTTSWFLLALGLRVEGRHWKGLGWGWNDTGRACVSLAFFFFSEPK